MQHLRILFQRLQAAGLVITWEKCVFGVEEVEFLGHHLNATGVAPIASHILPSWSIRSPQKRRSYKGSLM
jgi:hypothetical protein